MSDNSCQLCHVENAKYSCPKCNISYCSVICYRSEKHTQCSEQFYENWVREELKDCEADPVTKKKMLEILKQSHQNLDSDSEESLDSDDEETEIDLASRMSNVNLDDEKAVWEKLTPEERYEFKKLITTGNIINILPDWEPWWKTKKQKTLIQDCEEEFDFKSLCPTILSDIPLLSTLTKSQPSPYIPFMVLNILASYAFTVRWFKGSHKDMPVESVSTSIALSGTLRSNDIFKNSMEAYLDFEDNVSKCDWIKKDYDKNLMNEDLKDIINGSSHDDLYFCTKASLSDLNSIISEAITILKENKSEHLKRFSGPPPKVSALRLMSKKMIYFLSWTVANGNLLKNALQGFA